MTAPPGATPSPAPALDRSPGARPQVRIVLPHHLRTLAQVSGEVTVRAGTVREVVDALEAGFPTLRGTLRDPANGRRRAFVRFFACREDLSHGSPDDALPEAVLRGDEPLLVVGAMAGG